MIDEPIEVSRAASAMYFNDYHYQDLIRGDRDLTPEAMEAARKAQQIFRKKKISYLKGECSLEDLSLAHLAYQEFISLLMDYPKAGVLLNQEQFGVYV